MLAKEIQVATTKPQPARRTLFISHANPEDNPAAAWFATRLALMGYAVWCDIKNMRASESGFWQKIQSKIENDAAKFIFILSDTSRDFGKKKGVYSEVQAAANLNRDNFIIPIRVTKLTGSVPILIGTDIYINAENWTDGLEQLVKNLRDDQVPLSQTPDYKAVSSWWPALAARPAVVRQESACLTSTILPISALPPSVRLLKVHADGNIIAGHERLAQAVPAHLPFSAHGEYVASFAGVDDFANAMTGFEVSEVAAVPTQEFLAKGWEDLIPEAAVNMATYWVATSLEACLRSKGLSFKPIPRSSRKIWYPGKALLAKDNHSIAEGGRRKSPAYLVGEVSSFRKTYFWHFGVQPQVDLRTHSAVLLSPKAIITRPYKPPDKPYPIDEKRALKALGWWNEHWRRKVLALCAWLSEDTGILTVRCGAERIILSMSPQVFVAPLNYRQVQDEQLMRELLEGGDD